MKMSCRRFTLIELLVVVTIIMLLASMLLPALHNARSSVQKTSCANNMKQIGVVLEMYAGDNKNFLPYIYGAGGPSFEMWFDNMNGYLPSKNLEIKNKATALVSGSIFLCPITKWLPFYYTTYILNGNFSYLQGGPLGDNIPLTVIRKPATTAIIMEHGDVGTPGAVEDMSWGVPFFNYPARVKAGDSRACISYPHRMSLNIGFADGHVSSQKRPAINDYLDISMDTSSDNTGKMYE